MISRDQIDRAYRIDCIDYGTDRGDWLLIAAGTGIMMATMDAEPRFRWCLDTDLLLRTPAAERFGSWLALYERYVAGRVCAIGWYSRWQNGEPMMEWLRQLQARPTVYFGHNERPELWAHCDLTHRLADFLDKLRES